MTDKVLKWIWKGKAYALPYTNEDILQLARAVQEEGYPHEAVAWTLIQRAAWLHTSGVSISLGKMVTQYAQPINPEWFPDGAKHLEEIARLKRLGDEKGVERENKLAAMRPMKAARSWESIDPKIRALVKNIFDGKIRSPVRGAVHYWASRGPDAMTNQAKKPGMILLDRGYGFGSGRNVFFAAKGSEGFGGVSAGNAGGSALGLIAVAALGYAAWKWLS